MVSMSSSLQSSKHHQHHPSTSTGNKSPTTNLSIGTSSGLCRPDGKFSKNCLFILDRYKVIKTIGKGTFGKVQLCQDTYCNNIEVAVKTIDHANIKTARERKNILREIRLVKILRHPNIIEILDMKETQSVTVIVMELAPHGELHDYVTRKKGLPQEEARKFFRQIISAVDYCHQSSVVHRDLKPENLLIDAKYNIKLIDFGFGNTYASSSILTTYCGSPFYAAPEMTQGVPYTGPEIDIWSMGVILYSMLTGALPFNGSNINELYDSIASGIYDKRPSKISKDADELLSRMLCVKPTQRITMLDIMQHPWVNEGYRDFPIDSFVPERPSYLEELDASVLEQLNDLGYDQKDYYDAFSRSYDKSPVKSLYHLHKEWLERHLPSASDKNLPIFSAEQVDLAIAYSPPESPTIHNANYSTELTQQICNVQIQDQSHTANASTPTQAIMNLSQQLRQVNSICTADSPSTPTTPKNKPSLLHRLHSIISPKSHKKARVSPSGANDSSASNHGSLPTSSIK